MVCSGCGADNAAGNKFCEECGVALTRACPSCANEVSPTAKFCPECGSSLGEEHPLPASGGDEIARESVSGGHRFVSVIFADIVAYTTFTEGRDSDEVREMLTVYFERSRTVIERFGGVVEKYIGDAIFGVWGSETVREDDAERAVRAALELVSMVSALGVELGYENLELRAGVMSGSTAVGLGGNESTGMVVGDLVNTAARLQGAAEPSTVFVGQSTHEVTERSIAYEDRGAVEVKGKSEPVPVWRALRLMGRIGADPHARELPFGGRQREMRLLKDWLEATTTARRSHLVSIAGEAGIGKSRLAREFSNHVDGFVDDVYWHNGRSPSYADGTPMWSLAEMVRQRAGILEDEDPARARTRLRTVLVDFVDDAGDRQWIERWLSGLLGLSDLPVGGRSELFSALRSFFGYIAERGTTVLVFEDLHWADDGVIEFITELVDRSNRTPILVVALARPELFERHPTFGARQRASVNVSLAPLAVSELRGLLDEYLVGSGAPSALVERVAERASGFPLYATEILRMLSNDGLLVEADGGLMWTGGSNAELAIPDTLQSVIGARLDRLDPAVRSLLQDAAVLGLTFQVDALRAVADVPADVVDAGLMQLVRLDVMEVIDDVRSPERGQYRFVQGLIQEVARHRLSRSDRRSRHLAAAGYFGRNNDPEVAGVVAQHLLAAYEVTPAGAERDALLERAVDGLVVAARRSAALHADGVAMDLFDRAVELAAVDDARIGELLLEAAASATADGRRERGGAYLDRAVLWFDSVGDDVGLVRAAVARSELLNSMFDSGLALEVIEPVFHGLADDADDELSLSVMMEAARSYSLMVRSVEAVEAADRALSIAERREMVSSAIGLVITRATALCFDGRGIEGIAGLIGAVDLAERHGDSFQAARAANNLASVYYESDASAARYWLGRMGDNAGRTGVREWIRRTEMMTAMHQLYDGDPVAAQALVDAVDEDEDDQSWLDAMATMRLMLATARGSDDHREAFERYEAFASVSNDEQTRMWRLSLLAEYAASRGDWAAVIGSVTPEQQAMQPATIWIYAAVRLGDAAAIDRIESAVATTPAGPIRDERLALCAAVRSGLAGDETRCVDRIVDLLPEVERHEVGRDLAFYQAVLLEFGDERHPAFDEAARQLDAWLQEHELWGYAAMWEHLLPRSSPRAAESTATATG